LRFQFFQLRGRRLERVPVTVHCRFVLSDLRALFGGARNQVGSLIN
jgi:hypothetical protein